MTRHEYNVTLRNIASQHSAYFGIDTPMARRVQAQWLRRLRREYPYAAE